MSMEFLIDRTSNKFPTIFILSEVAILDSDELKSHFRFRRSTSVILI